MPRPRLSRLLDQALGRPLTLVTAPAGFGKTTVVAEWLAGLRASSRARTGWLSLDEDDDVPRRFLGYLLAAVRGLGDGLAEPAQALLDSGNPATLAVTTELINGLTAAESDIVLVFDDVHTLREPEILDAIGFLVENCPPRLHLVLLGRQEPDLPLARWRGRGQLGEIGIAQLRFSADEAAELLHSVIGVAVDADTAAALHRRAEGWAAGLQLLGIGLRVAGGPAGLAGDAPLMSMRHRTGDRYVLDYLAEEVLRGQPAELRDFLLRTSVLDALTPALCDAVTAREDSNRVIDRLERDNLFLTPLDAAGRWHRYHGLFADFLRAEVDPAVAAESHARAARWFARYGSPDETIKHAVAAGDIALAVATVRSVAEREVRRGELPAVLGWLNRLPADTVRSHADLAGFKGWLLYLAGRVDEAESYAVIAEDTMAADAPAEDRAMLRTFQAYLALTRGRPAQAAELAGAALDLLGDSVSFFRAAAMGALGQARRLTGDRRGAIDVLRAAVRLGERSGNPLSALEATGYLAPLLYVQGRLREAVLLCEDALRGHTDVGANLGAGAEPVARPPMTGLIEVPLGTLYYERDELDAARRHLLDGIARCERLGTTSYTLLGLRTLARLHVAQGAADDGLRALLAARRQADAAEDHRRARLVVATVAELHLRTGNPLAAERALQEISGDGADRPSTSDYEQLTRARLLIATGRPAGALDALAGIEARAVSEGRDGSLIAILTVGALARAALGDVTAARDALARAAQIAASDGYRRTFLDQGPSLVPLLRDVLGAAPDFVSDLLARSAGATGSSPERGTVQLDTAEGTAVVQTLTDTQQRILGLIATGMSNQQVADKLFITIGTTKWHLNQIFGRLQARNRTEAVARARQLNLL
ncbi:MAG TPA: LuxR C-terminal-related transcriptional regulator [Pseudonocardiaceae bacterium]